MAGLIAAIALGVIALALAAVLAVQRRRMARLTQQVEDFLSGRAKQLSYSIHEDSTAPLHNAVAELENALLLSRELQKQEAARAGSLMADISHQLKTPLASLRLFCELDSGPHAGDELQLIDKMERLVYALLRLERLCADGYTFSMKAHGARQLLEEAWQGLQLQYPGKRLEIAGEDVTLHCDGQWLGEALGNILKNACEHTAPGGRIRITLDRTAQVCLIMIEDDGGGVSMKDLPHLFERFYRAQGSAKGGSGIGLSMAQAIVRHHQGTIEAENGSEGLRITICLPRLAENLVSA